MKTSGSGGSHPRFARHSRLTTATLLAGTWLLLAFPLPAFDFEPITQFFSPSGPGATRSFEVTNTGSEDIAVKITMVTRTMNENGDETYTPAVKDFVVFPSQIVLHPGAGQTVRVRWTGPPDITTEQTFRIIAAQLPVDFGARQSAGGSINILFRYLGAVYVVPPGAKPKIEIVSAEEGTGPNGKHGLFITFANRGTAHGILNNLTLTVTGEAASGKPMSRVFESGALSGIDGANVLAGATRRFFLPVTGELPQKGLHVDFAYH